MNEYNGYKNYNTWNIVLWLHNDENAYQYVTQQAKIHKKFNHLWNPVLAKKTASEIMRSCFNKPETPDGVKVSSKDIDWKQVSDALNENI